MFTSSHCTSRPGCTAFTNKVLNSQHIFQKKKAWKKPIKETETLIEKMLGRQKLIRNCPFNIFRILDIFEKKYDFVCAG